MFAYTPAQLGHKLPPLLPPSTRAMLRGWRINFDFLGANPGRRTFCRPAMQGEISDRSRRAFPRGIVCIRHSVEDLWEQIVVGADEHVVDYVRDERGEAEALSAYRSARRAANIEWRALLTLNNAGEPALLGLKFSRGVAPNAAWVAAHWHEAMDQNDNVGGVQ